MYYQQEIHTGVPFSNEILARANVSSKIPIQPIIAKMQFQINSFINVWLNKKKFCDNQKEKKFRKTSETLERIFIIPAIGFHNLNPEYGDEDDPVHEHDCSASKFLTRPKIKLSLTS
jgi:hypothetical protein